MKYFCNLKEVIILWNYSVLKKVNKTVILCMLDKMRTSQNQRNNPPVCSQGIDLEQFESLVSIDIICNVTVLLQIGRSSRSRESRCMPVKSMDTWQLKSLAIFWCKNASLHDFSLYFQQGDSLVFGLVKCWVLSIFSWFFIPTMVKRLKYFLKI